MKLTITKKPFKGRPVGSELDLTDRQAKLLVKMGRGQYMTRDMVAAPVDPTPAPASAPTPAPTPAPAPAPAPAEPVVSDEVDATGAAWDSSLHVSTRLKNTDGTWRKRPGARAAEE